MKLLFAGASGLVGGLALPILLARSDVATPGILSVGRRRSGLRDDRLFEIELSADAETTAANVGDACARVGGVEVFACALGTTLRQAGSREAFVAVDRELVLQLAKLALEHGAKQAVLVSSVGASAASANFYLRSKGETEQQLAALGFRRCDFLRPGLLLGARGGPRRPGEYLAQKLAPLSDHLLHGPLRRYRSISAADVAAALAALCGQVGAGNWVHEHDAIRRPASVAD